jgi:outer membrane protein assembly factor BamA
VATPTASPGTQPDRVRLVFAVAHNINAKYLVEAVKLEDENHKELVKPKVSEDLLADIQKMVGRPVDDAEADSIRDRLATELKNKHVRRSVAKGEMPEHVRIVYQAPSENSIGGTFNGAGYHSRQKFSGTVSATYTRLGYMGVKADASNSADQLIERFAGYKYGAWIEHKRVRLDGKYSSFRAQWSNDTLYADAHSAPGSPTLYRLRDTIEPTVKVTITPEIHATVGYLNSLLQMQSPSLHFETVRTATGNLDYSVYTSSTKTHQFSGGYDIHVAGDVLGGAQSYTRHRFDQSYSFAPKKKDHPSFSDIFDQSRFTAALSLGRITGSAPMFERFSLGNIETLTGWNKYEIAPLGADRMAYASFEFSHKYFELSYQAGSLWDEAQPIVLRNSIEVRPKLGNLLHAPMPIRLILNIISPSVGVPLTHSNAHPIFTFGGGN